MGPKFDNEIAACSQRKNVFSPKAKLPFRKYLCFTDKQFFGSLLITFLEAPFFRSKFDGREGKWSEIGPSFCLAQELSLSVEDHIKQPHCYSHHGDHHMCVYHTLSPSQTLPVTTTLLNVSFSFSLSASPAREKTDSEDKVRKKTPRLLLKTLRDNSITALLFSVCFSL